MIDTNVLLDWVLNRDQSRSERIDKIFLNLKKIYIADLIIAELIFTLEDYYFLPRDIVFLNLSKVLNEEKFICNRTLFQRAIIDYLQHPSLSFVDCCLIHYADLNNDLPLWTFDKKLINQSFGRAKSP